MERVDSSVRQSGGPKAKHLLSVVLQVLRAIFLWRWDPPDRWITRSVLRVIAANGEAIGSATYLGRNFGRTGIALTDDHVVRPEFETSDLIAIEFEGTRVPARMVLRAGESQKDTALLRIEPQDLNKLRNAGLRSPVLSWSFENGRVVIRAGSRSDGVRFQIQRIARVLNQLPKTFLHELEFSRSPKPGAPVVMFGWPNDHQQNPMVYAKVRSENTTVLVSFDNRQQQRCLYLQFNMDLVVGGASGGAVVDVVRGSLVGTIEGRKRAQLFSEDGSALETTPGGGLVIPLNDFFEDFKKELRYFKWIGRLKRCVRLSIPTLLAAIVLIVFAGNLRLGRSANDPAGNTVRKVPIASLTIDSIKPSGAYASISGTAENLPDGTQLEYVLNRIGGVSETATLPVSIIQGKWEYERIPVRVNFQAGGKYSVQVLARMDSNPALAGEVRSNVKTLDVIDPSVLIENCRVKPPQPHHSSGFVEVRGTYGNDRQEEAIAVVLFGFDAMGRETGRWVEQATKDAEGIWTARVVVQSGISFDAYARFSSGDPGEDVSQLGKRTRCN